MRQRLPNLVSPLTRIGVVVGEHSRANELPAALSFSPKKLLADFPGPALLVDGQHRVIAANAFATGLKKALENSGDSRLPKHVTTALDSGRPLVEKIRLLKRGLEAGTVLELTFVPFIDDDGGCVLVLGRDTTFERNFSSALLSSRQLFRDLVNCSSDFAWETGPDGTFQFVSARGALGYSARELNGQPAHSLVHPRHDPYAPLPFESREALEDVEVWLRRADGGAACLLISSVPVLGEGGKWLGARGVCRDVTEARERDAALARARNREKLLSRIVDTIRSEIEPDSVLGAAAESTALAMHARNGWIFCIGDDASFDLAADFAGPSGTAPPRVTNAVKGSLAGRTDRQLVDMEAGGHRVLAALSGYHGSVNGCICVSRRSDEPPWEAEDRTLIKGVAAQLGIAIQQIASHKRLEYLSRTDELTGLLNRRAFFEGATQRLSHLRRKGRRAVVIYLDLDNFKKVNDGLGHQQGDAVLRKIAERLLGDSRAGDICGRIGGDEFVLWLEEIGEDDVKVKAELLLETCARVAAQFEPVDPPLGASIGIARSDPSAEESVTELVAKADSAMYYIKRHGKGGFAVAEPEGADGAKTRREDHA